MKDSNRKDATVTRRGFLKASATTAAVPTLLPGIVTSKNTARKPNLLVLWTDEQRADTMAAYGNIGNVGDQERNTAAFLASTYSSTAERAFLVYVDGAGEKWAGYFVGKTYTESDILGAYDIQLGSGNGKRWLFHSNQNNNGQQLCLVPDDAAGQWDFGKGLNITRSNGYVGIGTSAPTHRP